MRIAAGADVDPRARIGAGTAVWPAATVREHAQVGADCVIGRGAYVDEGVRLGDRVKVQNLALLYGPAVVEEGAFIGPAVVLTNDTYPRSVDPSGRLKRAVDWEARGVYVGRWASVGARAVVVAGVRVGAYALVGAGAVVTRDVPDYALVVGVPARRVGWVGPAGVPLVPDGSGAGQGGWRCPQTGDRFVEEAGQLRALG